MNTILSQIDKQNFQGEWSKSIVERDGNEEADDGGKDKKNSSRGSSSESSNNKI